MINLYEIILQQTIALGAISKKIDVSIVDKYSCQIMWVGRNSFSANVILQCSNDNEIFSNIEESEITITGTSSYMFNVPVVCYRFFRISISVTSGECDMIANICTKGRIS